VLAGANSEGGGGGVGKLYEERTSVFRMRVRSDRIPVTGTSRINFLICNGFGMEFSCLIVIFLLSPLLPLKSLKKNREIKEKDSLRAVHCLLLAYRYGM
jgi:hypothetical protein